MSTAAHPLAATTFVEAFTELVAQHGDRVGIRTLDDATRWTWSEVDDRARRVATGLQSLGVKPGDTIGLLIENRPEFHVADVAGVLLGAVPVSIYGTSSPEQIAYIASDAGLRVLITQTAFLPTVQAALVEGSDCRIVLLDGEPPAGAVGWDTLLAASPLEHAAEVAPDDLLTIIYTSGTTGPPKGVELTHKNLLTATRTVGALNAIEPGGRVICWLPLAHIAERIASYYAAVVFAMEVTTCPDPRQVGAYLKDVHPSWFFAVPRIWEKLKIGAEGAIAAMPEERRTAVQGAIAAATERVRLQQAGEPVPAELEAGVAAAEPVFAGLRAALGLDQVVAANIGAAPSAPELIMFFHALGIPLAEIYGMSENCACCTCNPRERIKIGSAGPPLPGIEVKLADDGELLMRGEVVMRDYRGLPEITAETFTEDGFLRTGDIARIDEDGYVWIVDRKKEMIISAGGKNMSPSNIEAAIKSRSPLIGALCVIGDGRPYNVALVVLDPDLAAGRPADDPDVIVAIELAVELGNARLSRAEQVKRFHITHEVWIPGGEELTPTMKLKRTPIARKYAAEIDALYAAVAGH